MNSIDIPTIQHPVTGGIRPPGSKSLSNRAFIVAALANGTSRLTGMLDGDDTQVMLESWRRLGLGIEGSLEEGHVQIEGCGGKPPASEAELWLKNSGTSIRFLTAACALGEGTYRLDGNDRMRERPIQDLVDGLQQLDVDARCELGTNCPPVLLKANGLAGGTANISATKSSQFLSGLLMAAPCANSPIELTIAADMVSEPYVEMTLAVMRDFGVEVQRPTASSYRIEPSGYQAKDYDIEPDASAASYFFALAAITGGRVTVEGLHRNSLQGDVKFVDALAQMGCRIEWAPGSITVRGGPLRGIDIDMNHISDTAQTLACVAPFAAGKTTIRNVEHNRYKETDRITAVVTELQRAGIEAEEHRDGMTIHPGTPQPARIETYDDHRMAMSFTLLGLKAPGITILDPGCTAKTFPHYFEELFRLCGVNS